MRLVGFLGSKLILNEIIIDQVHVSRVFAYLLVVSRPAVYFLMPKSIAIRCGVVENFNEMTETIYLSKSQVSSEIQLYSRILFRLYF